MTLQEYIDKNGNREIKDVDALDTILAPEKPKTVWDLEIGDEYFWLTDQGIINAEIWENHPADNLCRNMGNAFLTEEEAELERDRRIFLTKARREAEKDGWKPDWKGCEQEKWYWYVNRLQNSVNTDCWNTYLHTGSIHFQSEEALEAFLTEENKAEILRLWGEN